MDFGTGAGAPRHSGAKLCVKLVLKAYLFVPICADCHYKKKHHLH